METLLTQGGMIALIPLLIQWMKRTNHPWFQWIDHESQNINRAVSWTLGVLAAVGIHGGVTFDHGILAINLDFTQFTLEGLWHEGAAVGAQLVGQQMTFKLLRGLEVLKQIESVLNTQATPKGATV